MKKKIIIIASISITLVAVTAIFFIQNGSKFSLNKKIAASPPTASSDEHGGSHIDELQKETFGNETTRHRETAAAAKADQKGRFYEQDLKNIGSELGLGKIFAPSTSGERKLEYNIGVNYQIETIKAARAFFNQWIPRYGFLLNETAAGSHNGYMTLRVRVRSSNLYAALGDLDSIGILTSENITVQDHTENAVYQQMLGAREDIRARRRALANAQTGTGARNWEATENLLSQSEDKQLATRMEEWRINDRIGWATIQITLSLPITAATAPIEVPEFRNAFVGLLNILLQILYLAIYAIPLAGIVYLIYRGVLRIIPSLRRILASHAST